MILTNGSGAIGVKFNITRMLNILPSGTTKILSRGYNLLCEANSFNKNLLTIYCMLSVLWHPGGKGKREDEYISHSACSRGCFQLRGQINKQLATVRWVWWWPFARESWVKNGNSGIRLLDRYNKFVGWFTLWGGMMDVPLDKEPEHLGLHLEILPNSLTINSAYSYSKWCQFFHMENGRVYTRQFQILL